MTALMDFLAAFFSDEDERIHLRAFKAKDMPDAPDNRPLVEIVTRRRLATDENLQSMMTAANESRGWYFVVNAGGNADADITRFNAFFVEDDNLSLNEQHKRLDDAPLQPSIRVKTRKSVHAYWLIEGDCDAAAWRDIQQRLITHFDSDKAIKNPSRVMRLPFFNHVHYNTQAGEHEYKRVEFHTFEPDRRFSLAEMRLAFPQLSTTNDIPVNMPVAHSANRSPNVTEVISNGSRHNKLLSLAGSMRRRGMDEEEIFAALKVTNKLRCQPPLEEMEVLELCQDVAQRYASKRKSTSADDSNKAHGKSTGAREFIFTPLNQLLAEPEEDVSFVWKKTLPMGGFSICSAKPKVGKSTLARNLALAVSRGKPFLGRETVRGKVLYLCLEEKRAEIAKHFRRMDASDDNIQLSFVTPEDALTALQIAVAENEPVLTIIDPLSRIVRVRDFNDYGAMSRALEPLIDLARKTNCHIHALHHDGKGERDGGDALLGSTALFGAVDCHLQMKKRERGRTILSTQRYGEDMPETVVELEAETGLLIMQGDLQAVLQTDKKAEILASMSNTEELTEADVKERIGGAQGLISRAIRSLVEEGKVIRNGEGKRGNPYTYRKNLANPANLENLMNPNNLTSGDSGEGGFSRYPYIEKPRNLEISETDDRDLTSSRLFDASPLPEHTDQASDSLPQLYSYPCLTCSSIVSSEDVSCPNCDQNLANLPF